MASVFSIGNILLSCILPKTGGYQTQEQCKQSVYYTIYCLKEWFYTCYGIDNKMFMVSTNLKPNNKKCYETHKIFSNIEKNKYPPMGEEIYFLYKNIIILARVIIDIGKLVVYSQ